jgi:hypothetical protein
MLPGVRIVGLQRSGGFYLAKPAGNVHHILDAGYWMPDAGCRMLDAGCWILDTGYSILDTRYWMLDAG